MACEILELVKRSEEASAREGGIGGTVTLQFEHESDSDFYKDDSEEGEDGEPVGEEPVVQRVIDEEIVTHTSEVPNVVESTHVIDVSGNVLVAPNQPLSDRIKCSYCGKVFRTSNGLRVHRRRHTGEKPYTCEVCKKAFYEKTLLNRHMRIHTGVRPYPCPHCSRRFNQSSALKSHIRLHTGEKPHHCSHCDKAFNRNSDLRVHMAIHTGNRPHVCTHCDRSFAARPTLIKHLRTHTGERPYQCPTCSRFFAYRSSLKEHQRLHSGERPYKCDNCSQKFIRRRELNKHLKKCSLLDSDNREVVFYAQLAVKEHSYARKPPT